MNPAAKITDEMTMQRLAMVETLREKYSIGGGEKVLEIGAGSGYQTAVLAMLARKVFALERLPNLAAEAETRLLAMGYRNVVLKAADGTEGWDAYRPYDAILVAAGGPEVPEPLIDQLAVGGRLVIPVGGDQRSQTLTRITRTGNGVTEETFGACAFVPLIGEHGW